MKKTAKILGTAALALAVSGTAATAATLQTDANDRLLGATDVNVNGTLYDVQFLDGTCGSVVFGCGGGPGLAFSDAATALAAAQARFTEVFIGTATLNYNGVPSAINGIDAGEAVGNFYTAFASGAGFEVVTTLNHQATSLDNIFGPSVMFDPGTDTAQDPIVAWASWSPVGTVVAPVPVPSAGLLVLTGLGAMAALRRRKRRAS